MTVIVTKLTDDSNNHSSQQDEQYKSCHSHGIAHILQHATRPKSKTQYDLSISNVNLNLNQ